jgi:uncharacterized protein (DUF433 family)
MPRITSEHVELRNGGYDVRGSRVSLDSLIYAFRRGESAETILEHFPAIGCLAKVYGAIVFTLAYPQEINDYLAAVDREWEEARRQNPPDLVEKVRRARQERTIRSS